MYDYLFIDGQYYLRRNWSVMSCQDNFNHDTLLTSFLFTVLKIAKKHPAGKIVLLWDKRPYKKEEIIKEYKSDRHNASNELDRNSDEVEIINKKLLEETLSDSEKEELNRKLNELQEEKENLEHELELMKVMWSVKYTMLAEFQNFGLTSINEVGFEADDLAYLASKWCLYKGKTCILVSGDSDWECMADIDVDVHRYSKNNQDEVTSFANIYVNIPDEVRDKITPYEWYQLNDIYYGGHNNVVCNFNRDDISLIELCNKILDGTISDEYKDFYEYYKALSLKWFDINDAEKLKDLFDKYLIKSGKLDMDGYFKYQAEHNLMKIDDNQLTYYYRSVINKQNRELFN